MLKLCSSRLFCNTLTTPQNYIYYTRDIYVKHSLIISTTIVDYCNMHWSVMTQVMFFCHRTIDSG